MHGRTNRSPAGQAKAAAILMFPAQTERVKQPRFDATGGLLTASTQHGSRRMAADSSSAHIVEPGLGSSPGLSEGEIPDVTSPLGLTPAARGARVVRPPQ